MCLVKARNYAVYELPHRELGLKTTHQLGTTRK